MVSPNCSNFCGFPTSIVFDAQRIPFSFGHPHQRGYPNPSQLLCLGKENHRYVNHQWYRSISGSQNLKVRYFSRWRNIDNIGHMLVITTIFWRYPLITTIFDGKNPSDTRKSARRRALSVPASIPMHRTRGTFRAAQATLVAECHAGHRTRDTVLCSLQNVPRIRHHYASLATKCNQSQPSSHHLGSATTAREGRGFIET